MDRCGWVQGAEGMGRLTQRGKTRDRHTPFRSQHNHVLTHFFPFPQISEGGEDEDEDEAKEVYFVPQDPESRKCLLVHVLSV